MNYKTCLMQYMHTYTVFKIHISYFNRDRKKNQNAYFVYIEANNSY